MRGQVRQRKLLLRVQLDIIAAALDLGREIGIGAPFVDKMDEIVVHGVSDVRGVSHGLTVQNVLNIGVTPGIGHLRRKPALDRRAGAERDEHDLRYPYLLQRAHLPGLDAAAGGGGVMEYGFVVEVSLTHHAHQGLLRAVGVHAVLSDHRLPFTLPECRFKKRDIRVGQLLAGDTVVQHQRLTEEVDGGDHRDPLQDLDELRPPAVGDLGTLHRLADAVIAQLRGGRRAENMDTLELVPLKLKGRAPAQTVVVAQQDRLPVRFGVILHRLHAPGGKENLIQHLVRAVGADQPAFGVIAPCVHFSRTGQQILQHLQALSQRQIH